MLAVTPGRCGLRPRIPRSPLKGTVRPFRYGRGGHGHVAPSEGGSMGPESEPQLMTLRVSAGSCGGRLPAAHHGDPVGGGRTGLQSLGWPGPQDDGDGEPEAGASGSQSDSGAYSERSCSPPSQAVGAMGAASAWGCSPRAGRITVANALVRRLPTGVRPLRVGRRGWTRAAGPPRLLAGQEEAGRRGSPGLDRGRPARGGARRPPRPLDGRLPGRAAAGGCSLNDSPRVAKLPRDWSCALARARDGLGGRDRHLPGPDHVAGLQEGRLVQNRARAGVLRQGPARADLRGGRRRLHDGRDACRLAWVH